MITVQSIRDAAARIGPHRIRTPLVFSPTFSEMTGARVYLKLETLQKAGSFKIRGATNRILCNLDIAKAHGVVAASAGNHAQGVAVAAHRAGVAATIVMPVWASGAKQAATKGYGAQIVLAGQTLEESVDHARALAREGMLFIHPYDDEEVIAGQGTIGLEILEDLPDVDRIIVPVGGGGLVAGIAIAVRGQRPSCRVTGVQAAACPSVYEALRTGTALCTLAQPTLADGIRVTQAGSLTIPIIRDHVDPVILVEEDEIADAMLALIERKKVIAEGAGAAPLAALLSGRIPVEPGSGVVLVISGGNIDSPLLERVIRRALVLRGRILACSVLLEDRPGALAGLLSLIAQEQGNILDIHHEPAAPGIPIGYVRIRLEIETRGKDHVAAILSSLKKAGYATEPS
ncbi:MAG TPA: threonine ammonia-lyase [Methanoregulaceae archaeon]|nr:threonine ammonia-lyase [Methanoregulaceae archaeon]